MFRLLSLRWLGYHIFSLVEIMIVFHPFRFFSYQLPLILRPGIPVVTFLFALVCNLILYFPIVIIIGTYINIREWMFEPLIVTAFGIVFSTIFKYVTYGTIIKLVYDGHRLLFEVIGLYEKKIEQIEISDIKGISLFIDRISGSKNYKVCFLLSDGRSILIYVSQFKNRSQKKLEKVASTMDLQIIDYPKGITPVNDISIGKSR